VVKDYIEVFPALSAYDAVAAHGFVQRIPDVEVSLSKPETVERLAPWHRRAVENLGFSSADYFTAEQVHGADITEVTSDSPRHAGGVDGLMTATPGLMLGIHVADCGPVFILDPVRRAIALLHSGRKGTEQNISGRAIRMMAERWGSRPGDLIVQLGPCIRVPQYDVDFTSQILESCRAAGVPVEQVHDCGTCTALKPDLYYSYRRDLGKTGRLLALLGIKSQALPETDEVPAGRRN
jgi:copper oxidase (laccase) domain-containing protein